MRKYARVKAVLCSLIFSLCVLLPGIHASADNTAVYQTSVNDWLLDLRGDSMPTLVGGTYYVPYTVFDRYVTGVNLGVSYGQWKTDTEHTLTIYNLGKLLTFDLNAGTCTDNGGRSVGMRAVMRNGKVYVPLFGVCNYFDLGATVTYTPYGTLIRITNSAAVLSTERFVDAASSLMQQRYNAYMASIAPPPRPTPKPTQRPTPRPEITPTPTQPPVPHPRPEVSPVPTLPPEQTDDRRGVRVYMGFRCGLGGDLDHILDGLERHGTRGLFCFEKEDLADYDRQIRRMVGSGHMVGLYLPDDIGEETPDEYLSDGQRLLARIAHIQPHVIMTEQNSAVRQQLKAQGWIIWSGNINGSSAGRSASGLTNAILDSAEDKQNLARISMDDGQTTSDAIYNLLAALRKVHYNIRVPIEPELS